VVNGGNISFNLTEDGFQSTLCKVPPPACLESRRKKKEIRKEIKVKELKTFLL
jgi:hypothetical protein